MQRRLWRMVKLLVKNKRTCTFLLELMELLRTDKSLVISLFSETLL